MYTMAMMKQTTELQVREHLQMNGIHFEHNSRTIPELSESRYRPDFLIRGLGKPIVLEIDQDGHRDYDREAEARRMREIWDAFGRVVVFLRVFVPLDELFTQQSLELITKHLKFCGRVNGCNESQILAAYTFYPEDLKAQIQKEMPELVIIAPPEPERAPTVSVINPTTVFVCRRCGASFAREAHLTRHLKKIIVCPATLEDVDREELVAEQVEKTTKSHPCGFCDKSFTHESNKYRHRRTCSAYQQSKRAQRSAQSLDEKVEAIQRQIKKLSEDLASLLEHKAGASALEGAEE